MLTCSKHSPRYIEMRTRWRGNDHPIDLWIIQNQPQVANRSGGREALLHEFAPFLVGVHKVFDPTIRERRKIAQQVRAPISAANLSKSDRCGDHQGLGRKQDILKTSLHGFASSLPGEATKIACHVGRQHLSIYFRPRGPSSVPSTGSTILRRRRQVSSCLTRPRLKSLPPPSRSASSRKRLRRSAPAADSGVTRSCKTPLTSLRRLSSGSYATRREASTSPGNG